VAIMDERNLILDQKLKSPILLRFNERPMKK
jgi:hypothetical protein